MFAKAKRFSYPEPEEPRERCFDCTKRQEGASKRLQSAEKMVPKRRLSDCSLFRPWNSWNIAGEPQVKNVHSASASATSGPSTSAGPVSSTSKAPDFCASTPVNKNPQREKLARAFKDLRHLQEKKYDMKSSKLEMDIKKNDRVKLSSASSTSSDEGVCVKLVARNISEKKMLMETAMWCFEMYERGSREMLELCQNLIEDK